MAAFSYRDTDGYGVERDYFPSIEQIRNDVDAGPVEHGFVDLKGRKVGYAWSIASVINVPFADEAAYVARKQKWTNKFQNVEDMVYVELWGSPTRDGKQYGPGFNTQRVATVEEARRIIVRRVEQAAKRDRKKFVKEAA